MKKKMMSKHWFNYDIAIGEWVCIEADSREEAEEILNDMQEDIGVVDTFFQLSSGNWEIDTYSVEYLPEESAEAKEKNE